MNTISNTSNLPRWERVLVVVAHPDDESFGLGGVIHAFHRAGATIRLLCATRGEASTLGSGDLKSIRRQELLAAARVLGIEHVETLDLPDGRLGEHLVALTGVINNVIEDFQPQGILTMHRDGVTGHPDHVAAAQAAVDGARCAHLPILEWTLPADVAATLSQETGGEFIGHEHADVVITVDRQTHRDAISAHASQAVPDSPLWRRIELQGDKEYLLLSPA